MSKSILFVIKKLQAVMQTLCYIFCRSLRYAAYRQFTWWKHGYLGKSVRRVIPACVVQTIRCTFPDPNGSYTGFKDTRNDGNTEIDVAWEF